MANESGIIAFDRTPHASPASGSDADRAGSCLFSSKKALSYCDLWHHLLGKGLEAGPHTRESAAALFRQYGYYRLRGYWSAFDRDGSFVLGITLDDVMELVSLDEQLSDFLLENIFVIEIALREALSYEIAQAHGPYALREAGIFKNSAFFEELQETLARECFQGARLKLPYVIHYKERNEALPIWAAVGLMSFGTVSKIFRNLSDVDTARRIGGRFGLKVPTMANWLRYLTQLRNMCAHRDRLYNIMFTVRPALFSEHKGLDNARLFPAFIVLFHMLETIDPRRAVAARERLEQIVDAHPGVDLAPIGFPEDWRRYFAGHRGCVPGADGIVRRRSSNAGRKRKESSAIDEALLLYDTNGGTIAEIAARTGVSRSTLYKYLNLRKAGNYPRIEYAVISLE